MPFHLYPNDCEENPIQLTLQEFINEGLQYYNTVEEGDQDDKLTFLKFMLAGCCGLNLNNQCSITLNVCQGLPDVMHSVVKVVLGSSETRRAILTERPTSFWAQWSRDEAMSFLGVKRRAS